MSNPIACRAGACVYHPGRRLVGFNGLWSVQASQILVILNTSSCIRRTFCGVLCMFACLSSDLMCALNSAGYCTTTPFQPPKHLLWEMAPGGVPIPSVCVLMSQN